jgi:poly-gamma-glutamate capsule biosynthesis protein CapA/YwtB (metallophosphatase superfamily)
MSRRAALIASMSLVALVAVAAAFWRVHQRSADDEGLAGLRGTGPLAIAAAGDIVAVTPWPALGTDAGFDEATSVVRRATLAVANLEETLRNGPTSATAGWPIGSSATARDLRRAGFTIIARANNHGADGGAGAVARTSRVLDGAGLRAAGTGSDLETAFAGVSIGSAPRRVALVALTTSASDEARATETRGEILGRPGVAAIRIDADVTADPRTYATLAEMARSTQTGHESSAGLELAGRLIKRGAATSVHLTTNPNDERDALSAIVRARATADVVVVSIHSHEPGNLSVEPAPLLRELAHQAIDRGAALVVGHGPRQLRGVEVYGRGVILYSLGNFAFEAAAIPPDAGDVFDANTDLNELALGAMSPARSTRLPSYDAAVWWESVIATATFDAGVLKELRFDPIDLGVDRPIAQRGLPRRASPARANAILERIAAMSAAFGTTVRIDAGVGYVQSVGAR